MYIQPEAGPDNRTTDPIYNRPGQQWSRIESALHEAFATVQDGIDACPLKVEVLTLVDKAIEAVKPVSDHFLWTPQWDVTEERLAHDRAFIERSGFPFGGSAVDAVGKPWWGRMVKYTLSVDIVPGETGDPSDPDFDPEYVPSPVERLSAVLTVEDPGTNAVTGATEFVVLNTFTWSTDITALDDNIAKAYFRFIDWYHGVRDGLRVIHGDIVEFRG